MSSQEAVSIDVRPASQLSRPRSSRSPSEPPGFRSEANDPLNFGDEQPRELSATEMNRTGDEARKQAQSSGSARSRSAPLPESAEENQPHASAASPESRHQSKDLHQHQSALLDEFFAPAVPMPSASSVGSVSHIAMNEPSTSKRRASSSAVLGPALVSGGHWTLQTRKQSDETSSADQGLSPSRHDDIEPAEKVREGDSGSGNREIAAADGDNASPSKRIKSDIAPWMTQRHKRAIRRSLEAAAASSSPAKSPAAKPATASDTSA